MMYAVAFYIHSITYAMRGKKLLGQNGIAAKIERSVDKTDQNGCGYMLIVSEQWDRADRILKEYGIPIRRKAELDAR